MPTTSGAPDILDVGCADGSLTRAISVRIPTSRVHGIDLDGGLIERARSESDGTVWFERVYLRELLDRDARYDCVLFASVLHEFFSYGEGISSVVKALADAHELLRPGGVVVVRDMALPEYTRRSTYLTRDIADRIRSALEAERDRNPEDPALRRFHDFVGEGSVTLERLNHYLLKSPYADNWENEVREDYTAVSVEEYHRVFTVLGMSVEHSETYLIPYLRDLWKARFGLTDNQLRGLRSTSIIVARRTD